MASALSDKATAVFAFAAYHQLTSGEAVSQVILADGKGHQADPGAVDELTAAKLATVEGNHISFTDSGMAMLEKVIGALRGAV